MHCHWFQQYGQFMQAATHTHTASDCVAGTVCNSAMLSMQHAEKAFQAATAAVQAAQTMSWPLLLLPRT